MDPLVLLLLGIIIGLLVGFGYLLFVEVRHKQSQEVSALETLFEEFMDELDERQERIRADIMAWENQMQTNLPPPHYQLQHQSQPQPMQINDISEAIGKRERVLKLAAHGIDSVDIAKQLGIGRGEVELILQLEDQKIMIDNQEKV